MYKKMAIISIVFLIVDQLLKRIIAGAISLHDKIEIIPDFFYLTYLRNDGAAWGILSGNVLLLIVIAFAALIFIYVSFIKDKQLTNIEVIVYGILFGGIFGNLIDRIVLGYVIDYLGFYIFGYAFPVFNLADIGIVISIGIIIFWTIREDIACKKLKLKEK